ncbi:serine protease 48-like [Daphnia carinata]|uniref:serine protease 48-like n=1 Tax=Daphnia carinata TaxID=120202 RepID=UPI002868A389|nr:serine protease 48-like [Daphnia carinata]
MRRTTFTAFGAVFVATIAMLGTVNGRVYQTNDSIVFEIDRTSDGVFLAKSFPRSQSDFVPLKTFLNGGMVPNWHIPLVVPNPQVNSYSIGLPPRQGLTFYSWLHHPFGYGGAYPVPAIGSTAGQTLKSETKQKSACHFGRIASGTEAKPNSWPFMVAFMSAIDRRVECGGSLISENKILTAANCFEQLSMFEISILVVRLGMHTTGEFYGQPHDAQMTRRISRVAIHKAYNAQNSYYDIAVLTMDTPVTFSKAISPVCLPTASNNVDIFAGKTGQIMGWGDLETGTYKNLL